MSASFGFSPWRPLDGEERGLIEPVDRWIARRLRTSTALMVAHMLDAGLDPFAGGITAEMSELFELAAGLIAQVPDLHRVVATVVQDVYPLRAAPGYDVSHSEPRWRSSIFVSVPERDDVVGVLRLAESIVHESMHLLLTNWEAEGAFVAEGGAPQYSPWRKTARPVQGVLHGTFVFACISAFFSRLLAPRLGHAGSVHVARRLDDISADLAAVDFCRLRSALTPRGATALDRWTMADGARDVLG